MKRNIIITLFTTIFTFFYSCEKIKNDWVDGKGLLQVVGTYKTFDDKSVEIEQEEKGLISYSLISDNKVLFKSKYAFSDYHKWYLIYDDNSNLWFYSGDIGSVYWKNLGGNRYEEVLLTKETISENLNLIPGILKSDLEVYIDSGNGSN